MPPEYAVLIKNAYKSYGKKEIFKNLCMKVERGTIYGLLGPSGCGKTTLLSCIVGRKRFDQGEIWVAGGTPGTKESGVPGPRVGYMPQDLALVGEFSVKGCIFYFGRILGMEDDLISRRYYKLKELLDLPVDDRLVRDCSGGQQRRISFAAAMVHEPELLILDEPTVGLDPVLRDRIWEHLVEITKARNIAVIITTHYIEEARQANYIGLMREGRLLAEASPETLIRQYNKNNLEDVFLLLSKKQEDGTLEEINYNYLNGPANYSNRNSQVSVTLSEYSISKEFLTEKANTKKVKKKISERNSFAVDRKRCKALLGKNYMQFARNLVGVLWSLAFPVIEVLAFFLGVGTDVKGIGVAIVNNENMNNLCGVYNKYKTAVPYNDSECSFSALSCRFIDDINDPMIEKKYYSDLNMAMDGIMTGKVAGVIYMKENFTNAFYSRFVDGRYVSDVDLDFGEIKVWLDMSNRQIGSVLKYKLYKLYFEYQKGLFRDCNYIPKLGELPVRFEDPIYGSFDDEYTVYMISGVLMSIMFFMGTTMTSTIIISDRMEGVWDRSIVAGVTSQEILLTHFISQFLLIIFQVAEIMIIAFVFYKIDYKGSMNVLIFLTLLQGLCGMCYGFWISIFSDNHNMANIAATGSFFPMIIVSGLIWPLEAQPVYLQWFSKIMPVTVPIISFRNVMSRGWSITNFQVYIGIIVELLWILFLSGLNILTLRRKR